MVIQYKEWVKKLIPRKVRKDFRKAHKEIKIWF